MEADIKREFEILKEKLDSYIKHQEKTCELLRKPMTEHLKDAPYFRDKLVKMCESLRLNWILTMLLITGAVSGFFWLIRYK